MSRTAQPPRMVTAPMPPDAPYFIPPSNITATRGRPRIHPDPPKKPLAEMTSEERRQYDSAKSRRHQANKQPARPRPQRIYGISQVEAEACYGPSVVAMKKRLVSLPVDEIERMENTIAALRQEMPGLDAPELLGQALKYMLDALERKHNKGEPFPAVSRKSIV